MTRQNKVLIVEHSPVVAEGLKSLFEETEYRVISTLPTLESALERLPALNPDILVLNPMLIDFSQRLKLRHIFQEYPNLLLAAMQTFYCEQSVLAQFHTVLDLEDNPARISTKLKNALEAISHETEGAPAGSELSMREKEVLKAISKGYTNKQVADMLHLSVHTVITHRKNISHKTGIKTLSGLTLYALINHLIDENEIQ